MGDVIHFSIEHEQEFTVVVIERYRRGGPQPRIRRLYLTADEVAELAAVLARNLPPATVKRISAGGRVPESAR